MLSRRLDGAALAAALGSERPPVVIDVRPLAAYETGHVPGSRHVPVHELAARRAELPANKVTRICVVGEPGKRAEAAANWLVLMGFGDVDLLEGGIGAWPGPLETGPPPPPRATGPELRVLP